MNNITEQDLLSYLLAGLDDAEDRRVEVALESSNELRQRMLALRSKLDKLNLIAEPVPPADLFFNTCRKIANWKTEEEIKQKQAGRSPARATQPAVRMPASTVPGFPSKTHEAMGGRGFWRRADVIVLLGISVFILMMLPAVILQIRHRATIAECSYNLKNLYHAMGIYEERNQQYPLVDYGTGPTSRAGYYAIALKLAGACGTNMNFNCPGENTTPYSSPPTIEEARKSTEPDYWKTVGGSYAYNIGYSQKGSDGKVKVIPVDRKFGNLVPLLSDRPMRDSESKEWHSSNSPNHSQWGQNVLYVGGHVIFEKSRKVMGIDNDIYLNKNGKYAPGLDIKDAVLLPSEVQLRSGEVE